MMGLLLMVALLIGGLLAWQFMDLVRQGLGWAGRTFVTHNIEESFRHSVTQVISTNGDILEVATLETDESVVRYDMKSVFNNSFPLGTTISEIRVPVVYRYHIRLSDPWKLSLEPGGQVIVHAPEMRPSLPPAIRTEGMERKSEAGWLRFNASENLATLEKNLTSTLEKRAGNRSHLNLARESSRRSVAEFVKKWLLTQDRTRYGPEAVRSITVLFPDELHTQAASGPRTLPPTVELP